MKHSTTLLTLLGLSFTMMATAQTRLAEWNFESTTDVTEWFNNAAPALAPDQCEGDAASYNLTALSSDRYWQLCSGYQNRVLRIENTTANAITDYTDASQHNVYYEVSFPTQGYKNISLEYAIAYGANAEAAIEAVVSVDGGTTWADAGQVTTAATWWTYNKQTLTLSANNKEKVVVRLIAGNGLASNWNMDYLNVLGEADASSAPIDAHDATVTWPFDLGANNPTSAEVSIENAVSTSTFTLSNLTQIGTRSASGYGNLTLLQPIEAVGNAMNEGTYVSFMLNTKKGITFVPKALSFNATKVGTSGGTIDLYLKSGDQTVELLKGYNPLRANDISSENLTIEGIEPTGSVELIYYIYNLANNKQLALNAVKLTGDFAGTPEAVPTYTMQLSSNMEGAGNVSLNPAGTEFDEGTLLTVSATENFGYQFEYWADAEGQLVTSQNPYSFEIMANTSLQAIYTQKTVYPLHIALEGGAQENLVTVLPAGTIIDGTHWYEAGTQVSLTAVNNPILTFTNWDDNSTDVNRSIVMDQETSVTAYFSACDYIVGWDFYFDTPNSERPGDYKAETDNAGMLSMHRLDGTTAGWLAKGVNAGKYLDKYCAVNWRPLADDYYYEISFSAVGYSNIRLTATMGSNYNAYEGQDVEYSLDGQNYTKVGTLTLPARAWTTGNFPLPADCNGAQKVYVRFKSDRTTPIVAVESANDGTMITDIFVFADRDAADDTEAPVLVSTLPAEGANDASSNGSIILTFNEKIALGQGAATLGDEQLVPTISGKNAIFQYSGLAYGTGYTFTLPAGVVTDRNGNAFGGTTLHFTTMERIQPEARLWDAVIAQDGTGDYATIQEAIDAAPAGCVKPWLIFVKEGTYTGHVDIPASKPYLHFIGQGMDKVFISDNRLSGGDNAYHVSLGATVVVNSANCLFEGISFVNSWGKEQNAGPQALALYTVNDRIVLNKCGLYSYQDTYLTTTTANYRHYVKDCFIEGAVDFIYGQGNVYFDACTINVVRKSGGYIVAPNHVQETTWGYVFQNCRLTAPGVPSETSVWLGRPWHNAPKTVFLNTIAELTIPASGWYQTMGGLPDLWAEYNTMDADGNPLDLSNRNTYYYYTDANGQKVEGYSRTAVLTAEEAAQYTIKNVLSGNDTWQPALLTEACEAPVVGKQENVLSWQAVPYAISYVVLREGQVVGFTTETTYIVDDNAEYSVQSVSEYGCLSAPAKAGESNALETLQAAPAQVQSYDLQGRRTTARTGLTIQNGRVVFL